MTQPEERRTAELLTQITPAQRHALMQALREKGETNMHELETLTMEVCALSTLALDITRRIEHQAKEQKCNAGQVIANQAGDHMANAAHHAQRAAQTLAQLANHVIEDQRRDEREKQTTQ
jgi:hypothetical protein